MPTRAVTSQQNQLRRGDGGGSEIFTLVAEILNYNGPTESAKQIDVTSVDSVAHEFISGLIDSGAMSFSGNLIGADAQQNGLRADMIARVRRNFQLMIPGVGVGGADRTYSFAALVVKFGIKGSVDKQVEFDADLKITGPVIYDV